MGNDTSTLASGIQTGETEGDGVQDTNVSWDDDQLVSSLSSPLANYRDDWLQLSRELRVPFYVVIFVLGVVGNTCVIITLMRNRHFLTVTNLFLLNLSVSDLLLGMFCMPFTLVGALLRDFIFGEVMCKLIPYFQAVSIAVSVWTLVAISLERYYAICRPLHSRRWQTLSHAYKTVIMLWLSSSVCMLPIATLSRLLPTTTVGRFKCREKWPSDSLEKIFNLTLDALLLVFPLIVMCVAYSKIAFSLWEGIRLERQNSNLAATVFQSRQQRNLPLSSDDGVVYPSSLKASVTLTIRWHSKSSGKPEFVVKKDCVSVRPNCFNQLPIQHLIRSNNHGKNLLAKKRVIRMLFVVVVEFFVCWTPLFVINTWALFDPTSVYSGLGLKGISFFQLLAYISVCCNPITYCFMNKKFRHGFLQTFGCVKRFPRRNTHSSTNGPAINNNASFRQSSVKSGITTILTQ